MEQKNQNIKYIRYRKLLILALFLSILNLIGVWVFSMWLKIPSSIHIISGTKQEMNFDIPATGEIKQDVSAMSASVKAVDAVSINMSEEVVFYGNNINQYKLNVKLFGFIPFKTADLCIIDETKLKPVGLPIGIYVKTDGILVLEAGDFKGIDGDIKAPAVALLQEGDYILKINGEDVSEKSILMDKISQSDGSPMILTIRRDDAIFDLKLYPQKNEMGEYKLGIWIRDNAQGVGTMTFIDQYNHFGALGHGINDVDTSTLMSLKNGNLYETDIVSIKKGVSGIPGELTGVIAYNDRNKIGDILSNSKQGIFGVVTEKFSSENCDEYMDVGLKQEVTLGPAQILCCIGEKPQYYDVEITAVHLNNDNINRGIELKITDPELLSKTGGIIQGMSGSPVIQNGKIVGAVTHVLVSNPEKGYAIFIENMLLMR